MSHKQFIYSLRTTFFILMTIIGTTVVVYAQDTSDGAYTAPQIVTEYLPSINWREVNPDFSWDDGEVGFIYFFNKIGSGQEPTQTITLETEFGPIVGTLTTTKNNSCISESGQSLLCPDTLELHTWPNGLGVSPMILTVDEQQMGSIAVYELLGS